MPVLRIRQSFIDFFQQASSDFIVIAAQINDQSVLFLPAEKGGKILYRNYLSDFLSSCYTDIRQIVAGKTDSLSQKRKIQKFFFRLSQRKRTQTFQINIIGHM